MSESPRALVATSRSLFEVDVASGERRVIDEGHGLYPGVTWDDRHYFVAARWYPPYTPTSRIERPRLLVFDADFELIDRMEFPVVAGGLHQIIYRDGLIYCSCSREDRYVVGYGRSWEAWYPSPDPQHHDRDTHHFNSVWIDGEAPGGGRLFILGHNNGPSDVWELTYPDRTLVRKYRAGRAAHNVWREADGSIALCNSRGGQIETVDGRVLCETGGFPRGVAIGDGLTLVGISSVANRSNRWLTSGALQVYDADWRLVKRIELGRCGQVNEVRLLSEDAAHHGAAPPRPGVEPDPIWRSAAVDGPGSGR
ncbi:MAG: hypothetical protein AAFX50_19165 [Acidobacteriota bacterium]